MWAIVPLKSPQAAKSRLRGVLDAPARERLFYALARHVLTTLAAAPAVERVIAATASEAAASFARGMGAEVLPLAQDEGTAQACRSALASLHAPAQQSVAMIAADLPLLNVPALAQLHAAAQTPHSAGIAPDRKRIGTNALVCKPPELIAAQFGERSFERHVAAARRCGAALTVIESDALALDIDDVEDLHELSAIAARGAHPVAAELLALLAAQQEALTT